MRRQAKEIVALDGISFSVHRGELFGFIGPNGAGKTTTIKILSALLLPTSGTAKVLGADVTRDAPWLRKRIGFMLGGERGLYWRLSGIDNLRYFADLYGVDPRDARRLIPELLDFVGLGDRGEEKVQGYSRGMKQRLHVARVMISDPKVLFLDEPTLGMDPVGAKQMREAIRELQRRGKTILVTSHDMHEVEVLCGRVAIIDHGRILALDSTAGLKAQVVDRTILEVELPDGTVGIHERLRGFLNDYTVRPMADGGIIVTLQARRGTIDLPRFISLFTDMRTGRISVREPTLQDVYEHFVSRPE
jgi:ABC-2 type transport system ATP-binding protein